MLLLISFSKVKCLFYVMFYEVISVNVDSIDLALSGEK